MSLIKIKNGLLEQDNFYMTSPFSDFLGVGTTYRDSNFFYIRKSEDRIERLIDYPRYMVIIEKENWGDTAAEGDEFLFYISDTTDMYGIQDRVGAIDVQHTYHKIIYSDTYVQCYVSDDKLVWDNVGGTNLYTTLPKYQGFMKKSDEDLKLIDYKVYSSPFLTVYNYPQDFTLQVYHNDNKLYKERLFDGKETAEVFLDYPIEQGYLKILDVDKKLVYTSDFLNINYGDSYLNSTYDLQLEYKGVLLPEGESTEFDIGSPVYSYVTLVNDSPTKSYTSLTISTETDTPDTILLSLDGITYTPTVLIPLLDIDSKVDIYISVTRGSSVSSSYTLGDFVFKVN